MKTLAFAVLLGLCISPAGLSAQQLPYRTGQWIPDSLGNHRVVVHVSRPADGSAGPHSLAPPRHSPRDGRDHRGGTRRNPDPQPLSPQQSPASTATSPSSRSTAPATTTSTTSRTAGRSPRTIRGSSIPLPPPPPIQPGFGPPSRSGPRCPRPRSLPSSRSTSSTASRPCRSSRRRRDQALVKSRGTAPFLLFPGGPHPRHPHAPRPARELGRTHGTPERHRHGHARRVVRLPGRCVRQQAGARQRARELHRLDAVPAPSPRRPSPASTSMASTGAVGPSLATSPSRRARSIPSGAAYRSQPTQRRAATRVTSPSRR